MNKYIEIIKENNSIIIKLLNEFNKLLLEEKEKKTKGKIKSKTIEEYYDSKILNDKSLGKYKITNIYSDSSFVLYNENGFSARGWTGSDFEFAKPDEGLFIQSVCLKISKQKNEVIVKHIQLMNRLVEGFLVGYTFNEEKNSKEGLYISLSFNKHSMQSVFSIVNNEVVIGNLNSNNQPTNDLLYIKKQVESFPILDKIDRESFLDYLFLGKEFDKEISYLLLLSSDVDLKNNNILRINLLNNKLNLKNNKKLNNYE